MELKKELLKKVNQLDGSYLYRTFKIKYLPCTNYQGARVKITDCNFEKSIILGYDYYFGSITQQAMYHLLDKGFEVVGIVSGDKEGTTVICCKWTNKELNK